ncbi:ankyrin repeat-containing domain protein, partial [Pyronema domesticum]
MANLIVRFESAHLVTSILDNWEDDTIIKTQLDRSYSRSSSLLLTAASVGNDAIVKLLLQRGAILGSTDCNGDTALTAAIYGGHETTTRLLLDHGIDLEPKPTSGYCTSALWCAVSKENEAITRLLLEKGANTEAKDRDGKTPLVFAASQCDERIVRLLLEKGANMEAKNFHGATPVHNAASHNHEPNLRLLLEKGADIEAKNENGETP